MKFKKRLLSEEVGLPKTNKKTYTKGKKQKVVVSEEQLQRLIKLINEKRDEKPSIYKPTPTNPTPSGIGGGMGVKPSSLKPSPTDPTPSSKMGKKPKGFGETPPARPKPLSGQKAPCPPGQIMTPQGCSSLNPNELINNAIEMGEQDTKSGRGNSTDGHGFDPEDPTTSPVKKKCCKCRGQKPYSLVPGKKCPKSCPEVPCKGKPTPPTQGNVTYEGRKLKTTNPISESEIRGMKKWFNRVNKAGTAYNPIKG